MNDSERVIELISDIIVNEFNFKLEFDTLDSDILAIEEIYNKSDGGCFWIAESIDDNNTQRQKIVGTTVIRNFRQFESICELKRMYVRSGFRRLGVARALYLKKGFVDIPRYNNNYRADVFIIVLLA